MQKNTTKQEECCKIQLFCHGFHKIENCFYANALDTFAT